MASQSNIYIKIFYTSCGAEIYMANDSDQSLQKPTTTKTQCVDTTHPQKLPPNVCSESPTCTTTSRGEHATQRLKQTARMRKNIHVSTKKSVKYESQHFHYSSTNHVTTPEVTDYDRRGVPPLVGPTSERESIMARRGTAPASIAHQNTTTQLR
jgi:hypothetical protein